MHLLSTAVYQIMTSSGAFHNIHVLVHSFTSWEFRPSGAEISAQGLTAAHNVHGAVSLLRNSDKRSSSKPFRAWANPFPCGCRTEVSGVLLAVDGNNFQPPAPARCPCPSQQQEGPLWEIPHRLCFSLPSLSETPREKYYAS